MCIQKYDVKFAMKKFVILLFWNGIKPPYMVWYQLTPSNVSCVPCFFMPRKIYKIIWKKNMAKEFILDQLLENSVLNSKYLPLGPSIMEESETCWKSAGNLLELCWKPAGNLLETFWNLLKPAGNLLEICWKPDGNLMETCWKPTGNLLETFCKLAGNLLETCWKSAGNLLETWWKSAGNLLETCWKPDGNLLETCRKHAGKPMLLVPLEIWSKSYIKSS